MSSTLIGLVGTLCLLIVGCAASAKVFRYENGVPLQIGNYTEIKCDLPNVESWKFKDRVLGGDSPKRKHTLSEDKSVLTIQKSDYNDEGNYVYFELWSK